LSERERKEWCDRFEQVLVRQGECALETEAGLAKAEVDHWVNKFLSSVPPAVQLQQAKDVVDGLDPRQVPPRKRPCAPAPKQGLVVPAPEDFAALPAEDKAKLLAQLQGALDELRALA